MKALLVCLARMVSPGLGATSCLKWLPSYPGAVRGGGVVADVNDRPAVVTPPRQQLRNILLGTRVVSRPDGGVIGGIDGLLDINDQ